MRLPEGCEFRNEVRRQAAGQRRVIGGDERRALPAGHHVGRAHVMDHRQAQLPDEEIAPTDLDRQSLGRAVQHRLAMKADDIDRGPVDAALLQEARDRFAVAVGERDFQRRQIAGTRVALPDRLGGLQRRGELVPECRVIGVAPGRSAFDDGIAIRVDQRHVDAVERRAAHQADGAAQLRLAQFRLHNWNSGAGLINRTPHLAERLSLRRKNRITIP